MTSTPSAYARPSIASAASGAEVACCANAALATGAHHILSGDVHAGLDAINSGCARPY